ncbi:MAG: hypothetical protein HUK19_02280 [Fibrobacter sp.]|nr:hypothetical protein [Fibrobacter sp.]
MDDINFVRVDILENWRFWNQFRNDPAKAGLEVIAIADALLSQDMGNEHAARLIVEAKGFRAKRQDSGRLGGLKKAENQRKNTQQQNAVKTAVKTPNQAVYGRFENVYLTTEQFNGLANDFGNINELKAAIESLSSELEEGRTVSQNHYATLVRWASYRKSHPEEEQQQQQQRFETVSEHNMRVLRQGLEYTRRKYGAGQPADT